MRILGVVDLLGGHAVHAKAGSRDQYEAVRTIMPTRRPFADGDPVGLAQWYIRDLGVAELYAADLDAIQGRPRQDALVASLAEIGAPLWLDAGITTVAAARSVLELAAAVVVVGLETMLSYSALAEICAAVGGDRVAFSLDLRAGEPIVHSGVPVEPPHVMASRAADAGAGAVIVLDLARVGTASGPDLALFTRVREAVPGVTLLSAGGVRGSEDLARLAAAGCDGALIATALHDGRLGRDELATARNRQRRPSR